MNFHEGLYEQIITENLKTYLDNINKNKEIEDLEKDEADIVLSRHIKNVLELTLKQDW